MTVDSKQWVQPLFMVYDKHKDELAPLTQERLDELLAVERTFGGIMLDINKHKEELRAQLLSVYRPTAGG